MKAGKLPPPLERDVSRAIVDYFAAVYRITLHRRNTGAVKASYKGKARFIRFSTAGQSDLWGILPKTGRHIEIEVKRAGKEPDDDQSSWLASCRNLGAIAFWANSVDMAVRELEKQAIGVGMTDEELIDTLIL